jgi:hypothetical protein
MLAHVWMVDVFMLPWLSKMVFDAEYGHDLST